MNLPVAFLVIAVPFFSILPGCGEKPVPGPAPVPAAGNTPAGNTPAAAPAAIDACSFVSADDVKAATGKAVTGSGHGAAKAPNVCEFQLEGGDELGIVVYTSAGKKTYESAKGDEVPGLGDGARWRKEIGMLAVLKGDRAFLITMPASSRGTPDGGLGGAKALAAKVLSGI